MKNILDIFKDNHIHDDFTSQWSLTAQLEVFCGGYFVSGEGFDEWIKIYYKSDYDVSTHSYRDIINIENLIAYVSLNKRVSLVLTKYLDKLKKDSKGYGLSYYPFKSFDQKEYYCSQPSLLPKEFYGITWIKDDFLYDERIEFDFEAFERIDSGIEYLNPNHFSIHQFMKHQIQYTLIHKKLDEELELS